VKVKIGGSFVNRGSDATAHSQIWHLPQKNIEGAT